MKHKSKAKLTIIDLVSKILESDLPISTRNAVVNYYLLPKLGRTQAIIEDPKIEIGGVERPSAQDVRDMDPRIRAGDKEAEKVMAQPGDLDDDDEGET